MVKMQKKETCIILLTLLCIGVLMSFIPVKSKLPLQEPPHILYHKDQLLVHWVEKGKPRKKTVKTHDADFFMKKFGITLNPADIPIDYRQEFSGVSKFAALSDIHGQYDTFVALLQEHQIVDSELNWIFGNGHLIITGDVFDRGDKVSESLWLIHNLEQSSRRQGGRVHYLIGNHDLMIFHKDLRYVNQKYLELSEAFGVNYSALYSDDSYMGKWLRSRPVMVKINDVLFLHGGISMDYVNRGFNQQQTNQLFIDKIFPSNDKSYRKIGELNFLARTNGPLWYRGYFKDDQFNDQHLNRILERLNVRNIMVGHTSQKQIRSLFGGRLFTLDSSIKNGKDGEVLLFENHQYFRGMQNGEKIPLG